MKRFVMILIVFLLILFCCYATSETIIQVMQPNVVEEGIESSVSTYIRFIGYPVGYSVRLTCTANKILTESGAENRNIANIFNLEVKQIQDEGNIFSDTLIVEMTIPENINPPEKYQDYTLDEVVYSTIKCVLYNAFTYKSIKFVDLRVVGNSKFIKLSKIYKRKSG